MIESNNAIRKQRGEDFRISYMARSWGWCADGDRTDYYLALYTGGI